MRLSNLRETRLTILSALSCIAFSCSGQLPGSGSVSGVNAAFMKLFGEATSFQAKANVRVLDEAGKETMTMPMDFAVLDHKVKVNIDMSQMKSADMSDVEMLKKIGIANMNSVIRPDKKLIYLIYPDQKSYFTMPMPAEESGAASKPPTMQKTPLEKETLDGHECQKNNVVVMDEKGQTLAATTWNARDLKDFPVQIQTKEKEGTSIVKFKDIKFIKTDPKDFDPPAGYSRYKDAPEMMQAIMKKMAGGKPQK
jgi:hypothetical protein